MIAKLAFTVAAVAATIVPVTLAVSSPAAAQRGYSETYVDRDGYAYRQDRRGANYDGRRINRSRDAGVSPYSAACNDPSYRQDPRCYRD